jgi:long-chain acyl-CoA synthetase
VRKGRDTPILNKIVFGKTSMLLGGHMRAMLSGGAPLEEATQRFMEICIKAPCVIGYGLTETCGGVAINDTLEIRSGRTGGVIDT